MDYWAEQPGERRGSRHENRISGPCREPPGAETDVCDICKGRWHDHPLLFFSLPPSWRKPESHVLQLPAVWFLVAGDVIRARTNWPPFLCCSLSSLFLLLLFFPPPVFPVCFFFSFSSPQALFLPWQDTPIVSVRVLLRDPGLGGIKIKFQKKNKIKK